MVTDTVLSAPRKWGMPDAVKETSDALTELALDLRWSWNHAADELWAQLDPERWDLTRNAWVVLQTGARDRLKAVAADPEFTRKLHALVAEKRRRAETPHWFQRTHPDSRLKAVAYFSMEFMLSDSLPIYSGGLGNVAGDQLKSANDLGIPVVGISLLYQRGYFRQHIDAQGRQQALYPYNDPGQLPVTPVRRENGEWLIIEMDLPGFRMNVRIWQAQVGHTKLYLLDTNDPANLPEHRGITSELYGGDSVTRLQQEQVLGIAGWRLMRALGINPQVCHLNEGHAAFAVLERARSYMEDTKQPFDVALEVTRAGNIFTTHTPVAAGFDRFSPDLIATQFRQYTESKLRISMDDLLALGRIDRNARAEPFNMALLAVRGSGAVNGVSRLHGEVSRHIFQGLFPRWPADEVPIGYVTNGIHVSTWDSVEADDVWTRACGKSRWSGDLNKVEACFRSISRGDLWKMRTMARKRLVDFVRQRLARQLAGHGASPEEVATVEGVFDPDSLTLGFARRFATYKRPNLLLHDPDRLLRILTNRQRPVQLILAGKAHPQDAGGQEMIRQWIEFIRMTPARSQAVFLSDYDMRVTEHLVQGVDLWLNTPRRPWEACGTSGMKVLSNGGLNLSELDGWWAEAMAPEVGWSIGDGQEHDEDPAWDATQAEQLYDLLESQVIPEFYQRDATGLPPGWVTKIAESMARLTPAFSSNRAVRQYTENYYLPAADAYLARSADNGKLGAAVVSWSRMVADHWPRLRFGELKIESDSKGHSFCVQAYLDEIDPNAIQVQLYADGAPLQVMTRGEVLTGSLNGYAFTATVQSERPAADFTPRIVPHHEAARVPLEARQILWYR
jgi:starch phosphorylase